MQLLFIHIYICVCIDMRMWASKQGSKLTSRYHCYNTSRFQSFILCTLSQPQIENTINVDIELSELQSLHFVPTALRAQNWIWHWASRATVFALCLNRISTTKLILSHLDLQNSIWHRASRATVLALCLTHKSATKLSLTSSSSSQRASRAALIICMSRY